MSNNIVEWLAGFNQKLLINIEKAKVDKVPYLELTIEEANILYNKLEEVKHSLCKCN